MNSMTLEINRKCNLQCKYCYLGEKDETEMSIETALKAIDIGFRKTKIHRDKKLWFDFVGGEALLDFKKICRLVEYIEEQNKIFNYKLNFSMTTNATIFTQEILDFLIKYNFNLKISLDGKKDVNDINRISKGGYSVHDEIIKNLHYFRSYENALRKYVQLTNVITENNYMFYYDSLVYFTQELGLHIIDTGINLDASWGDKEKKVIEDELEKSLLLFLKCAEDGNGFYWSFADRIIDICKKKERFFTCGAGIVTTYVRTDGSIYACLGNVDESKCIGHINTGFITEKVNELKTLNGINNEKCTHCELNETCSAKACIMRSLTINNDINKPDPLLCWLEKVAYRLYKKYEHILKKVDMRKGA